MGKDKIFAAAVEDPNAEKHGPLQEVKGQVQSSSVALSDLPQKTDVALSSKKHVKYETGKVKEKDSAPVTESCTNKLVKEDYSLKLAIPPASELSVSKEHLKESKKEKVGKPQSRMDKSEESSATQPSKKNMAMERLTAQGVSSKVSKTRKETSGIETKMKDEEDISATKKTAEYDEDDYHTTPSVTQPRRVQPDWLAKLQELKLRSLDQF